MDKVNFSALNVSACYQFESFLVCSFGEFLKCILSLWLEKLKVHVKEDSAPGRALWTQWI